MPKNLPTRTDVPSTATDRAHAARRLNTEIYTRNEQRLRTIRSPILDDPKAIDQLKLQVELVVADMLDEHWPGPGEPPVLALGADAAMVVVDADGSLSDVLAAACLLFDSALEVFEEELPAADTGAMARSLNRVIGSRMVWAALAYVDRQVRKLHEQHDEERRRISRELHDRIAHAVGAGLQNIEMYQLYRDQNTDQAAARLATATGTLLDSLELIRELSAGLRDPVGPGGLLAALETYLIQHAPTGMRTSLVATGSVDGLPRELRDELFIVLREAVRNALVHGRPNQVAVSIAVSDGGLVAEVVDDGVGFAHEEELETPTGIGLSSMRERWGRLGGAITWSSSAGGGTVVRVVVERDWRP